MHNGLETELNELANAMKQLAPSGFMIGLEIKGHRPMAMRSTYPKDWIEHYERQGYALFDPVVHWGMKFSGVIRWKELESSGLRADQKIVLEQAGLFGLKYGVALAHGSMAKGSTARNMMGAARSDRDFRDGEIDVLKRRFQRALDSAKETVNLDEKVRDALRVMKDAQSFEEGGAKLLVSAATIRKRIEKARKVFGTKNTLQTVAQAIEYGLL